MRKAVEGLLTWFVPVSLLALAAGSVAFALSDRGSLVWAGTALGLSALQIGVYLKLAQSLIFAAANLVAAVWLALQHHSSLGKRTLWSLFGLASGLWAVTIWLLVLLSERRVAADS